jgi:hypothetical protein
MVPNVCTNIHYLVYNQIMRQWNLPANLLPSLTLAADARLTTPDFVDDQIWGITQAGGEPAALSLFTTYGLRASRMRMFPRFAEGGQVVSNPNDFFTPLTVHQFAPNYLLCTFAPLEGLDVVYEAWVPESHAITGRIRLINSGTTPRIIRFEWVVLLTPNVDGQPMVPERVDVNPILVGKVDDIEPVVVVSGASEASRSPFPSFQTTAELDPGTEHLVRWVHAAEHDSSASRELANQILKKKWDAEIAHLEMLNASWLDIHTGNDAWDQALALGQAHALALLHGPTEHLPYTQPVHARQPDLGFSPRGDGSEYDHLWSGQTPLDLWYFASQVIHSAPDAAENFLQNFIHLQTETGEIPWRAGLNGKHSSLNATPLLAIIAWDMYEITGRVELLKAGFEPLLKFFNSWFTPTRDQDEDGIPEWSHPLQTGFDENPIFSFWESWSPGADIAMFESPALCAMLYRECQALINMAHTLNQTKSLANLQLRLALLEDALNMMWDDKQASYHYIDRETHYSTVGKTIGRRKGNGSVKLSRFSFEQPIRLLIYTRPAEATSYDTTYTLVGTNENGSPHTETISNDRIRWSRGTGTVLSDTVFASLDTLTVDDAQDGDQISIHTMDLRFQDQTNLLPLWSGAPTKEQAERLVKRTLLKPRRYWRSYGLPACPQVTRPEAARASNNVWLLWNSLIGEGLVRYGYRDIAAELFSRLMNAITTNLNERGAFFRHHDADTGEGYGDRNVLASLPPLGLFLDVLGVQIFSPWKVRLQGQNPFPHEITLKYCGMIIVRGVEQTTVTFPNGKEITITDPAPCIVQGRPA